MRASGGGVEMAVPTMKSFVLQGKKKVTAAAAAGVGTLHLSRQIGCGTPPD